MQLTHWARQICKYSQKKDWTSTLSFTPSENMSFSTIQPNPPKSQAPVLRSFYFVLLYVCFLSFKLDK